MLDPNLWLPAKILKKIEFTDTCWNWKGYVIPPRYGVVGLARVRPDAEESHTRKIYTTRDIKPQPRVSHDGRSVPAVRVVFTYYLERDYEQIGRLKCMCQNPICVNPDHWNVTQTPVLQTEDPAQPEPLALFELLKQKQPSASLGPLSAAEEVGVPSIPDDVWAQYLEIYDSLEDPDDA